MSSDITIQIAQPKDAEGIFAVYAPYVRQTAITFEYAVPSTEEFKKRITKTLIRYPYLIAKKEEKIVGYAYASPFKERAAYDWAVEISIYVDKNQKRQAIGKKLYEALEELLKEQGILNINACIASPRKEDEHLTKDSIYFHEKMGFHMVGKFHECGYKFNQWYDMVWMEKKIGEHKEKQPPVKLFSELLL